MTTAATALRAESTGNGVGLNHPYDWKINSNTELLVTKITDATGAEETLTVGVDYTVTGVGNDAGGNVVINPALASGFSLVIIPNVEYKQDTDFTNQNSVPPEEVESALDKLSIQIKSIIEVLNRTVKLTVGSQNTVDTYLEDCQTAQAAAEVAQAAAETAETNSESSETAAAASAAAAAASALNATIGNLFGLTTTTPASGDFLAFTDTSDSNNAKKATAQNIVLSTLLDEDDFSSDSATQAPTQQSVKAYIDTNSSIVLLGNYTASNVTSVDIGDGLDLDALIDNTYNYYIVRFQLIPVTDNTNLVVQTGNEGSFDTSGYHYGYHLTQHSPGGGTPETGGSNSSSGMTFLNDIGNGTNEGIHNGFLLIGNASNTSLYTFFSGHAESVDNTGVGEHWDFGGSRQEAAAHDRIRFLMSSGNILSGEFILYGVK